MTCPETDLSLVINRKSNLVGQTNTKEIKRRCKENIIDTFRRLSTENSELRNEIISPIADAPVVAYVQTDAHDYPVYDFMQRRIQGIIGDLVKKNIQTIFIIAHDKGDQKGPFFECFNGHLKKASADDEIFHKSNVIFAYIGGDDTCFDWFRQKTQNTDSIMCKITPQGQSSSENGENIHREVWGFQCFAKDLSKDTICTYIDDVLEHYAFEVLNREAHSLQALGKFKEENLAKIKSLYKKTKIPMPDYWIRQIPKDTNKWKKISKTVLSYPLVFGCDTSKEKMGILILKENVSKLKDVTQHLESLGLSEDEFDIQVVDIQPLGSGHFASGDKIHVRGSQMSGTLGGFAVFQKNKTDERVLVAITAKHVVVCSNQVRREIHINNERFGEVIENESTSNVVPYDFTIVKVTASKTKCNTKFRFENGTDGFADVLEMELEHEDMFDYERVHLWGAATSPGVAEISSLKVNDSDAGDYICIETQDACIPFAKEGDSGAMVLMERPPRESSKMYAIGTLVGKLEQRQPDCAFEDSTSDDRDGIKKEEREMKKRYLVVPLQKGFQQLSEMHGGKFTLASEEDVAKL